MRRDNENAGITEITWKYDNNMENSQKLISIDDNFTTVLFIKQNNLTNEV